MTTAELSPTPTLTPRQQAHLDRLAREKLAGQRAMLRTLERTDRIIHACKLAAVPYESHRRWVSEDEEYARAAELARTRFMDRVEAEMVRRAIKGTLKPVFHKGEVCGHIREYSDRLLEILAKAHDHRYRESSGSGTQVNVQTNIQSNTTINQIRVIEDGDWYGNADRLLAAADGSSDPDLDE